MSSSADGSAGLGTLMTTSVPGCLAAGVCGCCAGWVGAVGVAGWLAAGVCAFGADGEGVGCAEAWLCEVGGGEAAGLGSLESLSTSSFTLSLAAGLFISGAG